jgi:hypothetical protein
MLKIKTYFPGQEVDPRIMLSLRLLSLPLCLVVSSLSLCEKQRDFLRQNLIIVFLLFHSFFFGGCGGRRFVL